MFRRTYCRDRKQAFSAIARAVATFWQQAF